MADNVWLDGSDDWSAGGNWSTAAAPTSSDRALLMRAAADRVLATSLPGSGAGINYAGLEIGPEFAGKLGSSATPLYLGSVVANVTFNAPRCKECWLAVDSGDSCILNVDGTSSSPYALVLKAGTWAEVRVRRSQMVVIGAAATVTMLRILRDNCVVVIESGATVTAIVQRSGVVYNRADIGALTATGGLFVHEGSTEGNITTVDLAGLARFEFASELGTLGTVNLYDAAQMNANKGQGKPRVITTLNRYGGMLDLRGVGTTCAVTTDNNFGGVKHVGVD